MADNPLVADAEVDEALVAHFNEKYRLETLCLEQCATNFRSSGNTEDTSCHAAIAPSIGGSAALRPGAGILTCGACSADLGIPATRALEHGRLPVVESDVLLQTKGTVDDSERRHPDS